MVEDACPSQTFCVVVGARKSTIPLPPISHALPKDDPPPPAPQSEPIPDTVPLPSTWRHCVEPFPSPETTSAVVEAVPVTKSDVVVAVVASSNEIEA